MEVMRFLSSSAASSWKGTVARVLRAIDLVQIALNDGFRVLVWERRLMFLIMARVRYCGLVFVCS